MSKLVLVNPGVESLYVDPAEVVMIQGAGRDRCIIHLRNMDSVDVNMVTAKEAHDRLFPASPAVPQ